MCTASGVVSIGCNTNAVDRGNGIYRGRGMCIGRGTYRHIYIYIATHIHIHSHTDAYAYIYMYIHILPGTSLDISTHPHMKQEYMHVYIRSCIHASTHTCIIACIQRIAGNRLVL